MNRGVPVQQQGALFFLLLHSAVETGTESGEDRGNAPQRANVLEIVHRDVTARLDGLAGWFHATPFSSPSSAWTGE